MKAYNTNLMAMIVLTLVSTATITHTGSVSPENIPVEKIISVPKTEHALTTRVSAPRSRQNPVIPKYEKTISKLRFQKKLLAIYAATTTAVAYAYHNVSDGALISKTKEYFAAKKNDLRKSIIAQINTVMGGQEEKKSTPTETPTTEKTDDTNK